jgi:CRP-like cAMP-binding protein
VRHEPGRIIYEAGRAVDTIQFLLEGRVSAARPGGEVKEIAAPNVVGFEAVIEGSPAEKTMKAVDTTIALSLSTDEFLSLLSENVEIAQGIFRLMIERRGRPGRSTVIHGSLPPSLRMRIASEALQPLDIIHLLQTSPLLARATATQLVGLANIAHPVELTVGADPLGGAEPSTLVVLSGAVRVEREDAQPETAEAGDSIAIYETLGGIPCPIRTEVTAPGRGLRFLRSEVIDVLADDVGLLRGIFSGLLRAPEGSATPHVHE